MNQPTLVTLRRACIALALLFSLNTAAPAQDVSALRPPGLDAYEAEATDSVEVTLDAGNGKVLAYLNAQAEIFRQEYRGTQVLVRCYIAKGLLHHVQVPGVEVRFLNDAAEAKAG